MHTNSSYPTPDSEINIAVVEFYNELSKSIDNLVPAYSSHDDGSFGSIMAVAAGAKMIEKHVKIGVNEWAHFDSVALDLENGEFKDYVNNIRKAEVIYGSNLKVINPSENHKYNNS
jgi:N-acetylneuraminate synthase